MAERTRPFWLLAVLAVVVLVVAGVGGAFLYLHQHPASSAGPRLVGLGDNVTVNYIGKFGSGPEQGRVFDTSIESVAKNNQTWPKSLEYSFRVNASFVPLGVHVAPNTPAGGYSINNTTFGGVVTGFWQGMIGMAGNQTRWVTIPASLAYGPLHPNCLVTADLVVTVPVLVSLPITNFTTSYPGVAKSAGTSFKDPTYGWPAVVFSVNATSVTVQNLPALGFSSSAPGWPITVTNVTGGNITVTNDITNANVGLVLGHSTSSVCSSSKFIVSAVDPAAGTFTENYNSEVTGQTLIFGITVVDIYG